MIFVWILLSLLGSCTAVIYHLNDTEYARMPPLWEMAAFAPCLAANGTYCVLQINLDADPGDHLMQTIQEYSAHTSKHYNHSVIERGVCVTDTCRAHGGGGGDSLEACVSSSAGSGRLSALRYCVQHDERAHADACRARGGGGGDSLEACVSSSAGGGRLSALRYCVQHDERAHADAWDCAVRALLLALVALNAAGTAYDYYVTKRYGKEHTNGNAYLLSFSVSRNWERLTNTTTIDPKTEDLQFLHGSRVISQMTTILMHVFMSYTIGFVSNPHDIEKASSGGVDSSNDGSKSQYLLMMLCGKAKTFENTAYFLIYNGMMVVQIFFFISGFLSFTMLLGFEDDSARTLSVCDLSKILLIRLSRLLPGLAMTMALTTSWVRHVGSGPLWKLYVTDSLVAQCRENWWHHLFFINNYMNRGNFCLIQTWHLAAEMQIFIVALWAYLISPRLLLALLCLSAVAPAIHTVVQDLEAVFITPEFFTTWGTPTFWRQHVLGHNNLSCFIIGMLTARKLYDWKKTGGNLVISRWWGVLQYAGVATIPLIMLSGRLFCSDGARASLVTRALYSSLVRPVLSLTCAVCSFAFINRTTTYIKLFFAWRGWVIPSRLSYCVYLLHMPIIHIMMGFRTQLTYYSFYNVMVSTMYILAVTMPAAALLHLTVEAPCIALLKSATNYHVHDSIAAQNEKDKDL